MAALLDESLDVITALWTGDEVHHHSERFTHRRPVPPGPVQEPRPPIWVAGMWPNKRPLERASQWDGVCPVSSDGEPLTPDVIAQVVAFIGTRPRFDVVAWARDDIPTQEFADAGATWLVQSALPDRRLPRRPARHRPPRPADLTRFGVK